MGKGRTKLDWWIIPSCKDVGVTQFCFDCYDRTTQRIHDLIAFEMHT